MDKKRIKRIKNFTRNNEKNFRLKSLLFGICRLFALFSYYLKNYKKAKRDREIADQARAEAEEQARKREAELLARAEREKAEAVERARSEEQQKAQSSALSGQNQISQPEPIQDQVITEDGKRIFVVTATFEVKAKSDTSHEKITSKLQSMIESAGITSLKSIEVR